MLKRSPLSRKQLAAERERKEQLEAKRRQAIERSKKVAFEPQSAWRNVKALEALPPAASAASSSSPSSSSCSACCCCCMYLLRNYRGALRAPV